MRQLLIVGLVLLGLAAAPQPGASAQGMPGADPLALIEGRWAVGMPDEEYRDELTDDTRALIAKGCEQPSEHIVIDRENQTYKEISGDTPFAGDILNVVNTDELTGFMLRYHTTDDGETISAQSQWFIRFEGRDKFWWHGVDEETGQVSTVWLPRIRCAATRAGV